MNNKYDWLVTKAYVNELRYAAKVAEEEASTPET